MSDKRPTLTLRGAGRALPATAPASFAGKPTASLRRAGQPHMNSSRPIEAPARPRFTISEAAARKVGFVCGPDFQAPPPRRDFRAAMTDAKFPAVSPCAGMPAPAALIELLTHAKRILLVGHVFPDHDTVGANLTLARALKLLHKDVDVCIDDELSHTHRRFAAKDEIKRAADLTGKTWDLAIVIDVASSSRIGGARELLAAAKLVSFVDHHKKSNRDDLESRFRAQEVWHDTYDAASLQVCAITEELLADKTIDPALLKAIYAPALGGMWTDTGGGTHHSMDPATSQYFKYIATKSGASVDNLAARVKFDVPLGLRAAVDYQRGLIKRQVLGESRRMKLLSIDLDAWNHLLATARAEQPHFGESDLMRVLKAELPTYERSYGCAALAVQQQTSVVLSARSNDGRANSLCALFRGSGHDDASSATLYGFASFDAAIRELERQARSNRLLG